MASNESTEKQDGPKLYAERDDWKDLTPIPQNEEGFIPLAPIMYGAEYKDATDYFRAIVRKREYSSRVLELTERIIRMNPSHYSVWQYRYDCLIAVEADLVKELELMDEIATKFLKTYQVWHHRRLLLTLLRIPRPELIFIANALQEDTKNYHTWGYRQWILSEFNDDELWDGEIPFVESMLDQDLRNNSAWHHRFFVVWESGVRKGEEDREIVLKREVAYTKDKISRAPNNASAWNYLRGVLEFTNTPFSTLETFIVPYSQPRPPSDTQPPSLHPSATPPVVDLENPLPSDKATLPCPYAIEFLGDVCEEKGTTTEGHSKEQNIAKAIELYGTLAVEHDTMRQRYWEFRQREAKKALVATH